MLATPDVNGFRMSSPPLARRQHPRHRHHRLGLLPQHLAPAESGVGGSFYGYRSSDGTNWFEIGTRTVSLPQTLYFGMAVTSHNTLATAKAQFRNLSNVGPVVNASRGAGIAQRDGRLLRAHRPELGGVGRRDRLPRRAQGPGQADFVQLATGVGGTGYQDYSVSPASTYTYRVQAVNASGTSGYSPTDSATTPGVVVTPALSGIDIGNPRPTGSTTEITPGKDYDIVAGGTDIAGLADHFHFASRQVTGDFDVKVRASPRSTSADPFTKAGLMVREDLTAGSRNAMLSTTFSDKGYRFTWRQVANDLTQAGGSGPVSFPNGWVRSSVGDKISGYRSTDGVNWTLVQSATITGLAQTVYVGLAATSHNETLSTTAQFRDFGNV